MKYQSEIVAVRTLADEIQAELTATQLRQHGIEALVSRDDPGAMGIRRSARVMVLRSDLEKAQEILKALDF